MDKNQIQVEFIQTGLPNCVILRPKRPLSDAEVEHLRKEWQRCSSIDAAIVGPEIEVIPVDSKPILDLQKRVEALEAQIEALERTRIVPLERWVEDTDSYAQEQRDQG